MPFWSNKVSAEQALKEYMHRSQRRIDQAALAIEKAEVALSSNPVDELEISSGQELLGLYVKQQEAETPPPLPGMEEHKRRYVALLDIQYRKLTDVISTGGKNLDAIIAEEDALVKEAEELQQGYRDKRES